MKAFVFTDKSLERYAGQFVWLSIDTENSRNAAFLKKFKIEAVPILYVIDPVKESAILRWMGGATIPQLTKILDDAAKRYGGATDASDELLAKADRLYGEGNNAEAAKAYAEVLKTLRPSAPNYGRTVESYLFALQMTDANEQCVTTALAAYAHLKSTASAANVAASGLGCALGLDARHPMRSEWVATLEKYSHDVVGNPKLRIAADDRSAVYAALVDARDDWNDAEGKKKALDAWATFLEGEAAKAKTPDQRVVFDSHRVSAYLSLGQPERAIPMLEASEHDFPNDYNPPARLALAYKAMKQWDKALAASDRAVAKAYGPRRISILRTRADIYLGKGDADSARKTLEQAIAEINALPEEQRSERMANVLKKQLESIK